MRCWPWAVLIGTIVVGALAREAAMDAMSTLTPGQAAGVSVREPRVRLDDRGLFRADDDRWFVPLGGLHGNVVPLRMLPVSSAQLKTWRAEGKVWTGQGQAVDLTDLGELQLRAWFGQLREAGVNSLRLFPRRRVGNELLDQVGRLNRALAEDFSRVFRIGDEYGLHFQLMLMGEPGRTGYVGRSNIEQHVRPAYEPWQLDALTPAQRRFLLEGGNVHLPAYFSDPDVRTAQHAFIAEAALWLSGHMNVFALELYNEQGWWKVAPYQGGRHKVFVSPREIGLELDWSLDMTRAFKALMPRTPVCLSHPGFGVAGYDPLRWTRQSGVDFYSTHLYAGLGGSYERMDFAAVTGATAAILTAGGPHAYGEWGVLDTRIDERIRRRVHRDAIWLSLLSGAAGFMQWTFDCLDEYRWPSRIVRALPPGFTPQPPSLTVDITAAYAALHEDARYPLFHADGPLWAFPFNQQKQADENLRVIFSAYQRSLDAGLPIRFAIDGLTPVDAARVMSLDAFAAEDLGRIDRPVRVEGGFEFIWRHDPVMGVLIGYLRSRTTRRVNDQHLAAPVAAALTLHLSLPRPSAAQPPWRMTLVNLQTDAVRSQRVEPDAVIEVSPRTSDDFVLILSPAAGVFEMTLD